MARTLGWIAALALLAPAGPVGSLIEVAPDTFDGTYYEAWFDHSIAYSDSADRYVAVYTHGTSVGLEAASIDPDTGAVAKAVDLGSGFATAPSIAWNASKQRFLVAYAGESYGSPSKIRALILDETGAPVGGTTPFRLNDDELDWGGYSLQVQVASNGDAWLVAWVRKDISYDLGGDALRGRVIGGDSTNDAPVLVTGAIDLHVPDNGWISSADIAGGVGSGYLAVVAGSEAQGLSVSSAGAVGSVLAYPAELGDPQVAANPVNGEYVLAGSRWNEGDDYDPVLLRAAADGSPIGAVVNLDPTSARVVVPGTVNAIWNAEAGQYLALWFAEEGAGSKDFRIRAARLNPDLSELAVNLQVAAPAYGYSTYVRISPASRAGTTQVILQWDSDASALHAQRYDLGVNPGTPALSSPGQFLADGVTAIPAGGTTLQATFTAKALLSDPDGGPVRLQVEVREAAQGFNGIPTATGAPAASGSIGSVAVPLAAGTSYRWQARAIDAKNMASAWIPFGSGGADFSVRANALPTLSSLGQFRLDDGSAVPLGARLNGGAMSAIVADADGDLVRLEIEAQPVGVAFTNVATLTSAPTAPGSRAEIAWSIPGEGGWHWQARVVDPSLLPGDTTGWLPFGGNAETEADFLPVPEGSRNLKAACGGSSSVAGGAIWILVALLSARGARVR